MSRPKRTSEEIKKIVELVKLGKNVKEIAPLFDISYQRISQLCLENGISIRSIRSDRAESKRINARLKAKSEQLILKRQEFLDKYTNLDLDTEPKFHRIVKQSSIENVDQRTLDKRKAVREYYKRNYLKVAARRAVREAISKGYINPTPCLVCGSMNVEAHHFNGYERALDVLFYCKQHHMELHNGDKRGVKSTRCPHTRRKPTPETVEKLKLAWVRRKARVNEINQI